MLWDCVGLCHPGNVVDVEAAGGISAIAISHPHFYNACADWADAFDCKVRAAVECGEVRSSPTHACGQLPTGPLFPTERALLATPAQVYLHAADRQWVTRPSPRLEVWEGDERQLGPGLRLMRLGGHFPGSCVLLWEAARDGKGVLFTGEEGWERKEVPASCQVQPSGQLLWAR